MNLWDCQNVNRLNSRYNSKWTRTIQDAILTVLLDVWLGGSLVPESRLGRLLTLEEVGELFQGSYSPLSKPVTL